MVAATLHRVAYRKEATLGVLVIPGLELCTLELPWASNQPKVSCIPPGKYTAKQVYSEKFGRTVYQLQDVPLRHEIEIHVGNSPTDTEGCILLGLRFGRLVGAPAVLQSGIAVTRFMQELTSEPVISFEIIG